MERNSALQTANMENVKDAPVKAREPQGGLLGKPVQWWDNSRNFFQEVRSELKRVTWPSRREVYATTVVVILTSILFGVYLWGLDLILSAAVEWIFRLTGASV